MSSVLFPYLGGSIGGVRTALNALNGSLLVQAIQSGSYVWRFKHPTIRDAFAALVAEDIELMDIYLTGTPTEKLFGEVSCGDVGIQGAKIIIPIDRYDALLERIESFDATKWEEKDKLYHFLAYRCDWEFLKCYITRNPQFITKLTVYSYLNAVSDVGVITRLHEYGLLPEQKLELHKR